MTDIEQLRAEIKATQEVLTYTLRMNEITRGFVAGVHQSLTGLLMATDMPAAASERLARVVEETYVSLLNSNQSELLLCGFSDAAQSLVGATGYDLKRHAKGAAAPETSGEKQDD